MHDFLYRVCGRVMAAVCGLPFGAAVALAFLLGACSVVEAAPVTFEFEAVVNTSFNDSQTGSVPEIPIEAGDTLTGQFTFDPNAPMASGGNPSATVYTAKLQFHLNDIEFSTDVFSVEVFDDAFSVGSLAAPLAVEDFDAISLGCSPSLLAECQPEMIDIPGVGLFRVSMQITLLGDLTVLDSTNVPGQIDLWNGLTSSRSLGLSFDAVTQILNQYSIQRR